MSEPCKFIEVDGLHYLAPADNESAAKFAKAKLNLIYRVTFRRMRNPLFHKKTFALINACYDNQDRYESREPFREAMKLEIGFVDFTVTTVRDKSPLLRFVKHEDDCNLFYDAKSDCSCGLNEACETDRIQTHVKTKSQSFGECSEDEQNELWPRICRWAVQHIGHENVNRFDGGAW